MWLALLRNLSHGSADGIIGAVGVDSSHQALIGWEARASNALTAETRSFYNDMRVACQAVPSFAVHTLRSDATNSNMCQESKVQNMEICTSFHAGDPIQQYTDTLTALPDLLTEHTSSADVLRVTDSSGLGCFALKLKQMRWNGCDVFGQAKTLTSYCETSDAGPDQKLGKQLAFVCCSTASHESHGEFHFDTDCLKHQGHIEGHDHQL